MLDEPTPYELLGGEEGVRRLVDRFYDLMDALPEADGIRQMHAKSLKISRRKLFMFMSGWLGGPSLYIEEYGHPRLRARHMPFAIGESEADQWMRCMRQALAENVEQEGLREFLDERLTHVANHMRNQL